MSNGPEDENKFECRTMARHRPRPLGKVKTNSVVFELVNLVSGANEISSSTLFVLTLINE